MTLEQLRKLCDSAMEEYNDGYMKAYKNIPDLVKAIEKLLTVAEAAGVVLDSIDVERSIRQLEPYPPAEILREALAAFESSDQTK